MTRQLISALLAVALLPFAAVPAVASSSDRSQPAPRAAARVRILDTTSPFSPNRDGHKDRVAVRYRLSGPARVSIEVTHGGRTVFRTARRATPAGKRSFVWNGTRANGKRVPDGRYRVVVRASAHGTTRTDAAAIVVRTKVTHLDAGTLGLSSATVYPYASVIDDVVVGNVSLPSTDSSDAGWAAKYEEMKASRVQVLAAGGRLVAVTRLVPYPTPDYIEGPAHCAPCGRFTWDGRSSAGARQPAGTYRIRVVQGRTAAGNLRLLTASRTVEVSRAQLVEQTTVLDLAAADAPSTHEPSVGCIGCEISLCTPSGSTRFPGGLSFDVSRPGCSQGVREMFTTPVAGRRTPYDSFDLSATGGPSTVGATASAQLRTGFTALAGAQTYPMSGETTVSTGRHPMAPNSEVYPDDWPQPVVWEVVGSTGAYDVASYRVGLHTYAPAA